MTINELNREQLIFLKQDYICMVQEDEGGTSWAELADADEIVPDEVIIAELSGVDFVPDDFPGEMR